MLLLLGVALGATLLILILAYLLSPVEVHSPKPGTRIAGVALIAFFGVALAGKQMAVLTERTTLPAVQIAMDQTRHFFRMLEERERFRRRTGRRSRGVRRSAGVPRQAGRP